MHALLLFLDSESLVEGNGHQHKYSGNEMKCDTKLLNLIRNAIEEYADDNGLAYMSEVVKHIINQASLDPKNYGYKKWGKLIAEIDLFEVISTEGGATLVRDKRKAVK